MTPWFWKTRCTSYLVQQNGTDILLDESIAVHSYSTLHDTLQAIPHSFSYRAFLEECPCIDAIFIRTYVVPSCAWSQTSSKTSMQPPKLKHAHQDWKLTCNQECLCPYVDHVNVTFAREVVVVPLV